MLGGLALAVALVGLAAIRVAGRRPPGRPRRGGSAYQGLRGEQDEEEEPARV